MSIFFPCCVILYLVFDKFAGYKTVKKSVLKVWEVGADILCSHTWHGAFYIPGTVCFCLMVHIAVRTGDQKYLNSYVIAQYHWLYCRVTMYHTLHIIFICLFCFDASFNCMWAFDDSVQMPFRNFMVIDFTHERKIEVQNGENVSLLVWFWNCV
jgi:hypothetical protein